MWNVTDSGHADLDMWMPIFVSKSSPCPCSAHKSAHTLFCSVSCCVSLLSECEVEDHIIWSMSVTLRWLGLSTSGSTSCWAQSPPMSSRGTAPSTRGEDPVLFPASQPSALNTHTMSMRLSLRNSFCQLGILYKVFTVLTYTMNFTGIYLMAEIINIFKQSGREG